MSGFYTPSRDPCPGLRRACALYGLSGIHAPRPAGSTPGLSFSRHVRPTQGPRPCRFPPFHVHLLRLWETAHFEISAFFIASIMSEHLPILYKCPALVPPMSFSLSSVICRMLPPDNKNFLRPFLGWPKWPNSSAPFLGAYISGYGSSRVLVAPAASNRRVSAVVDKIYLCHRFAPKRGLLCPPRL